MNYRIYSRRKPVKRVQLLPGDLPSKYQASLQPSFLQVWCWKLLLAAETTGLALATWGRRQIQTGRHVINDRFQRLAFRERASRCMGVFIGWGSGAFPALWHGLMNLGDTGLKMGRSRAQAIASWLHSQRTGARPSSWNHAVSRFDPYSAELRSLRLSPPRGQDLGRELADARVQLVEELLAEEEELTRVATRVARLQRLIRSQEDLLTEMACLDKSKAESSRFPAEPVDDLVGTGRSSGRRKLRSMPLFRQS
jgi:hypothetical protein